MYFASLQELWSMAGHGPYVWSAYALVLAVVVLQVRAPLARRRTLLRTVRARLERGAATAGSEGGG
jgi:heme exporter protein D